MLRSNIKLVFLILALSIFQIAINNSTRLYIDCLSVILVILLFSPTFSFRAIIILAIFADLIGHWYLGTHLLAVMLVSFLTKPLINFYNMSYNLQKVFTVCLFYAILSGIITAIGYIAHNTFINWVDFAIEIFILCPIIQILFNMTRMKTSSSDIIY